MIMTEYPVTDREIDLAYERESEKMWEAQQIPEGTVPEMRKLNEEETINAYAGCTLAVSCFDHTLNWIAETIDRAKGTVEADKLANIYDRLSDLRYETNKIKEVWDK